MTLINMRLERNPSNALETIMEVPKMGMEEILQGVKPSTRPHYLYKTKRTIGPYPVNRQVEPLKV